MAVKLMQGFSRVLSGVQESETGGGDCGELRGISHLMLIARLSRNGQPHEFSTTYKTSSKTASSNLKGMRALARRQMILTIISTIFRFRPQERAALTMDALLLSRLEQRAAE